MKSSIQNIYKVRFNMTPVKLCLLNQIKGSTAIQVQGIDNNYAFNLALFLLEKRLG